MVFHRGDFSTLSKVPISWIYYFFLYYIFILYNKYLNSIFNKKININLLYYYCYWNETQPYHLLHMVSCRHSFGHFTGRSNTWIKWLFLFLILLFSSQNKKINLNNFLNDVIKNRFVLQKQFKHETYFLSHYYMFWQTFEIVIIFVFRYYGIWKKYIFW